MLMVATIPKCLVAVAGGIILLFVTSGSAQDGSSSQVDRYIKDEMQKQQIPGLSLAVIRAGQIILAKDTASPTSNIRFRLNLKRSFNPALLVSSSQRQP
jgi:CubicO group peptidase (beta-lactamase class C family)